MEQQKKSDPKAVFVKDYKHYKTGKRMVAADYGYAAWRFPSKRKK